METQNQNNFYIPNSIATHLPAMVKNELAKMSAQKQEEFVEEYKRKAKSTGIAYVAWLLFGIHYAYLGKWGIQIIFWLTVGGVGIWWFLDLFMTAGKVKDTNKDMATDLMRNLKAISN